MTIENSEQAERRLEGHAGRRTQRLLLVFLWVSVALHAAVLGLLPDFSRHSAPSVTALEVVLLQTEAVVVAPPVPVSPPRREPPQPVRAVAPVETRPAPLAPVLALPEPQAREGASFTIEPAKVLEPAVAVPEQKTQIASVAVTPPVLNAAYLRNPALRYPEIARRAGTQGTVTLRVQVTREGLAARVDVEKSSGSSHLDAAALEAVKAWRFVPARQGAGPIESWVLVPIVFRLEGPG
jgi:periplasmic protein TonB